MKTLIFLGLFLFVVLRDTKSLSLPAYTQALTEEVLLKFNRDAEDLISTYSEQNKLFWEQRFLGAQHPQLRNQFRIRYPKAMEKVLFSQLEKWKELGLLQKSEQSVRIQLSTILPNTKKEGFYSYQWHLKNTGQTQVLRSVDEHFSSKTAIINKDINYEEIRSQLIPKMKKQILVAVIDSGVDFEVNTETGHPELIDSIYENEEECFAPVRKRSKEDPFPNDCNGWNATASIEALQGNVFDYEGHGTHIAGIIASSGYGKSVAGIVPEVKILPVKVYSHPEEPGYKRHASNELASLALSSYALDAIYYAIYKKADVINMSFGWPSFAENNEIKALLEIAREKNIAIVAAAGNDSSFSQVFPCSYQDVICVGSIGVDGKRSDFSNYGAHVDFQAPGEDILSTFSSFQSSLLFPVQGYEYLTGTSQAAPIISSFFAIAKALYPEDSIRQTLKRMYLAAHSTEKLDSLRSLPNMLNLERKNNEKLVLPSFKENPSLKVRDSKISAQFPMRNFSEQGVEINASLKILNRFNQFITSNCNISIEANRDKNCDFSFDEVRLKDFDSIVDVQLSISYADKSEEFWQRLHLTNDFQADRVLHLPNLELANRLPDSYRIYNFPFFLPAIDTQFESESILYFYKNTNEKEKNVWTFLELKENSESYKSIELSVEERIQQVFVQDINADGVEDYFLVGAIKDLEDPKKPEVTFYLFLDKNMKALFGENRSRFYLKNNTVALNSANLRDIAWVRIKHPQLGNFVSPIFWGLRDNYKEKIALGESKYSFSQQAIFYFVPELGSDSKNLMKPVLLDNNAFYKKEFKTRNSGSKLAVLQILPQSKAYKRENKSQLLLGVGNDILDKYEVYDISVGEKGGLELKKAHDFNYTGANLLAMNLSPVVSMGDWDFKRGLNYFASDSPKVRLLSSTESKLQSQFSVHNLMDDPILNWLVAFELEENKYLHFAHSANRIYSVKTENNQVLDLQERNVIKNTVVPYASFLQKFRPSLLRSKNRNLPAMIVEDSLVEASQFHILLYDGAKLLSPSSLKFHIDPSCLMQSPMPLGKAKTLNVVLLCENSNREFELRVKALAYEE